RSSVYMGSVSAGLSGAGLIAAGFTRMGQRPRQGSLREGAWATACARCRPRLRMRQPAGGAPTARRPRTCSPPPPAPTTILILLATPLASLFTAASAPVTTGGEAALSPDR